MVNIVDIPSSYMHKKFSWIFVKYLPTEFGKVELIADSYAKFSLKCEEQEGQRASAKIQIASLKSKVINNFHVRILQKSENKECSLDLILLFFK